MTRIELHHLFAERHIRSVADYRKLLDHRLRTRRLTEIHPQSEPLAAGLEHGCWLAWCPTCGCGVAVHPEWAFAACLKCGLTWSSIVFPDAELLARIDAVLSLRPPGSVRGSPVRFYGWTPDQTVEDLIRENVRHGWPVPAAA